MPVSSLSLLLSCPDVTTKMAGQLASSLDAGDTILLHGDVGAGKTHFARGLIQALLVAPEDVPSPTFTLVQVYETTKGEVWHADLYRLSDGQEVEELGLADAFETAICLIEWPDRLGSSAPDNALTVSLSSTSDVDGRRLDAHWQAPKWDQKLAGWQS